MDTNSTCTSIGTGDINIPSYTNPYGNAYWANLVEKSQSYQINTDVILSTADSDFNIKMAINNIHIQPISNGFIVNIRTKESGLKVYCFQEFTELLDMLKDCGIMTLDNEKIAENI